MNNKLLCRGRNQGPSHLNLVFTKLKKIKIKFKNVTRKHWKDSSVVKNAGCSSRTLVAIWWLTTV